MNQTQPEGPSRKGNKLNTIVLIQGQFPKSSKFPKSCMCKDAYCSMI